MNEIFRESRIVTVFVRFEKPRGKCPQFGENGEIGKRLRGRAIRHALRFAQGRATRSL